MVKGEKALVGTVDGEERGVVDESVTRVLNFLSKDFGGRKIYYDNDASIGSNFVCCVHMI